MVLGIILLFLFGLVIGSFLTVVVYRLPKGETLIWGRSHCQACKHPLGNRDLIPLVSFPAAKGRCRYCGIRLSWLYPIIECSTGAAFAAAYLTVGGLSSNWQILQLIHLLILFSLFVALFYIDWLTLLLPDVLVFSAFVVTVVYHILLWLLFPTQFALMADQILYGYVFGVGAFLAFLILILATKGRGMGGGDMKFALVIGAAAGWPYAVVALFTAFVAGAVISLGLIAVGRKRFHDIIPFGPFLIGGTIFAIVWGTQSVDFYLKYLLG